MLPRIMNIAFQLALAALFLVLTVGFVYFFEQKING